MRAQKLTFSAGPESAEMSELGQTTGIVQVELAAYNSKSLSPVPPPALSFTCPSPTYLRPPQAGAAGRVRARRTSAAAHQESMQTDYVDLPLNPFAQPRAKLLSSDGVQQSWSILTIFLHLR